MDNNEIKAMVKALLAQKHHNNEGECQYCGKSLEGLGEPTIDYHMGGS